MEQLSIALEDERESIKAMKKKHSNVIRDLQKQLQSSNRYILCNLLRSLLECTMHNSTHMTLTHTLTYYMSTHTYDTHAHTYILHVHTYDTHAHTYILHVHT